MDDNLGTTFSFTVNMILLLFVFITGVFSEKIFQSFTNRLVRWFQKKKIGKWKEVK